MNAGRHPTRRGWSAALLAALLAAASLTWLTTSAAPVAAAEGSDLAHLCGLNDYTPAQLPQFTALGSDGNIWFTDLIGIGRVTPAGVMTMFSSGVPLATLTTRITAGPDGALWYVIPQVPARIGRITTEGVATVFSAGIPPTSKPGDITTGPDGNLWFTGQIGHTIYRITPTGAVTPFPIPEAFDPGAITTGADGNLWFSTTQAAIGRMTPAGVVTMFSAGMPSDALVQDLTPGPDGEVWFADLRHRLGHISPDGEVTVIEVPSILSDLDFSGPEWDDVSEDARQALRDQLSSPTSGPTDITPAGDGTLWFSERTGGQVGKVTTDGQITFVAVTGLPLLSDQLPPAVLDLLIEHDPEDPEATPLFTEALLRAMSAQVWQLGGLSVGSDGNLWLRTGGAPNVPTASIARMTPDGQITSSPGSAYPWFPTDETVAPDGTLWYLAGGFGIGYVTPDGHSGTHLVSGARTMSLATSLTFGPDGNVWFTEPDHDRIVRMTTDGEATTFAAGITPGAGPYDLATGPDGSLWFTEPDLHRIGRITTAGAVTEFGAGITGSPARIVGGGGGSLWFTEVDEQGIQFRLARITTAGVVTELSIEANARITDLTSDPEGNIWVLGNTVGSDGMSTAGWIDRITPDGTTTRLDIDAGFDLEVTKTISVVDGDVWFSMEAIDIVDGVPDLSTYDAMGTLWRMTPAGAITRFDTAPVHPLGVPDGNLFPPIQHVVGGPDGALWFTRYPALPNLYRGTVPDHAGDSCNHDEDGDGPLDSVDNCPVVANTDQADLDADHLGDACDPDVDGDAHLNGDDAFPRSAAEWLDTDHDGIGNNADLDDDGDGLIDTKDPKPLDSDTDDDGKLDGADNCVSNANPNQADADHDGIGDVCDRTVVVQVSPRLTLSLQATLVDGGGLPVSGARIVFTNRFGGTVCTAVTDNKGTATCGFGIGLVVGLLGGYKATFNGDTLHDPATAKTW